MNLCGVRYRVLAETPKHRGARNRKLQVLLLGPRSVSRWGCATFGLRMEIRPAIDADHDAIWNIFHKIIAAGDTYAFNPQMAREEALAYWFRADTHTYVAEDDRESIGEADSFLRTATPSPTGEMKKRVIVGTYILRPNQAGGGSHVANAA